MMLKRLIEISRPVLWVNTIGTTITGMWLAGFLWTWDIVPILIWVTFPMNILIYGINDIFDQETDNINARKGGYEGAHIFPNEVKPIWIAVIVTNVPFLTYFALTLPLAALSNTDYAFPLAFVPLALGVAPLWLAVTGLMAWSIAKHAYDAIQDIPQDSDTGIITTAVHLGPKNTAIWATFWWGISTVLFALVNIPVAIVNAAIAGLLVYGIFKTPTPEKAHDLYKYSIAFPYIAGAVAGVQLVTGLVLGIYP